jgi:hypothetical protein
MNDWIFVKTSHRVSDPKSKDYLSFSEYVEMMKINHGLILDSLCPFEKKEKVRSFRVDDKGKAMMFALNNPEYIIKPE